MQKWVRKPADLLLATMTVFSVNSHAYQYSDFLLTIVLLKFSYNLIYIHRRLVFRILMMKRKLKKKLWKKWAIKLLTWLFACWWSKNAYGVASMGTKIPVFNRCQARETYASSGDTWLVTSAHVRRWRQAWLRTISSPHPSRVLDQQVLTQMNEVFWNEIGLEDISQKTKS